MSASMRIKQTPNGDYVVDIDKSIIDKLGYQPGDQVDWTSDGRLIRGRICSVFRADGLAETEYNMETDKYALRIFNMDRTVTSLTCDRSTMNKLSELINQALESGVK